MKARASGKDESEKLGSAEGAGGGGGGEGVATTARGVSLLRAVSRPAVLREGAGLAAAEGAGA